MNDNWRSVNDPSGGPALPATSEPAAVGTTDSPALPAPATPTVRDDRMLLGAFVWMIVALLLSAASAAVVMADPQLRATLVDIWLFLLIGQLALVFGIAFVASRVPPLAVLGLFFTYALTVGLTLGVIVSAFVEGGSAGGVVTAFIGASAVFAGAAFYGGVTKRDLTGIGGILTMALFGLIAVMVVRLLFLPDDPMLGLLIGLAGVAIFTGLTAYDVQRIRKGEMEGFDAERGAIFGALMLYLDFVNLFLFILSFMGDE